MAGPLDGVRILDCTTVVLGPWAAQQLGDLGADVVKIEPPEGDTTRVLGPARNPGMAAFYLGCNRSKRSIVLDLKQDAGRKALFKLAETADVFMHNYRPEPEDLQPLLPCGPEEFVKVALDAGGHDNITVVLVPFAPAD